MTAAELAAALAAHPDPRDKTKLLLQAAIDRAMDAIEAMDAAGDDATDAKANLARLEAWLAAMDAAAAPPILSAADQTNLLDAIQAVDAAAAKSAAWDGLLAAVNGLIGAYNPPAAAAAASGD